MKKSDLIILDGTRHQYPDLFVSMHRLGCNREVKKVATRLNLNLKNTAEEQDGTGYIGNINHGQALNLNLALNRFTLPTLYFADMLYQLIESINGNRKTYDGNEKEIDSGRLSSFYDEITGVRSPWRSEYLDGKFGDNTITYHKFVNGKFTEVTEELDDCLMKNKTPGIDLEDWLKNPTSQGLPRKNCKTGNLYYWSPVNGRVARFGAGSVRALLDCDGGPRSSGAGIGVRYSVSVEGAAQKISASNTESYTPEQILNALNEVGITEKLEQEILGNLKK